MPDQIGFFKWLKNAAGDLFTVDETALLSSKAPKASPVFTGPITSATHPAFLALPTGTWADQTGDGTVFTVIFDTEVFDQGANYNGVSTFTAPVTGKYRFSASVMLLQLAAAHLTHSLELVASNRTIVGMYDDVAANPFVGTRTMVMTTLVDMDAGDTAYISLYVSGSTKVVDIFGHATGRTFFSGELVS